MIKEAIRKIVEKKDLTAYEMRSAFSEIMSGNAEPAQISAFITGLRMKGETIDEISEAAKVMRRFASSIDVRDKSEPILDTCGTGGSGKDLFNISTASAFVVAGCGVKVAKHGNRSASSKCGSADLLEGLGVNIGLLPKDVEKCIKKIGIGFMFAPVFHSAMKHAVPVRKALGIRTIFNILGPLSNPANATCQVLGVFDKELTPIMAKALANIGVRRAFVVSGLEGLDEISISGQTQISELKNKRVRTYKISPSRFGIKKASIQSLKGGNVKKNVKMVLSVLKGKIGPERDAVLLNAAYGLLASGAVRSPKEGISLASDSIKTKSALIKLEQLKEFSNR